MGMIFGKIEVETASYKMLSSPSHDYSIRAYAPALLAETDAGDTSKCFRRLASYIGVFSDEPENARKQAVAMTAPVVSRPSSMLAEHGGARHGMTMAFVMPAEYSKDTLPAPTSAEVLIKELPARTVACVTFSGTATDEVAALKAVALEAMLRRDGLQLVAEDGGKEDGDDVAGYTTTGWTLQRYNPPWTLPFLKTNEVLIPIVPPSAEVWSDLSN